MATTTFDKHELARQLEPLVGPGNVAVDEPMSKHTTFKIGGPADVFVKPQTKAEIIDVLQTCRLAEAPVRILGNGSDVLVADEGLRCVVVQIAENFSRIAVSGTTVRVQAGATNAAVADAALQAELTGFEFASGIPGTIGGAAIMNAGAYDGEFADVCTQLVCLTPDEEVVQVSREDADWSYRHSMMAQAGYLVLEATLELARGSHDAIKARMDDLQQRRADKQPLEMPSAGSTFKRPAGEGLYAGKLIQDAGMQGHTIGGAQVSTKHAGFVVNAGGATAADVRQVIADVQAKVAQRFGVDLEPEVRIWG